MKKAVKIICILIVAIIIVALIVLNNSKASDNVSFYTDKTDCEVGESIIVTFRANEGNCTTIQLKMEYSNDVLEIDKSGTEEINGSGLHVAAYENMNTFELMYFPQNEGEQVNTISIKFKAKQQGNGYIKIRDESSMVYENGVEYVVNSTSTLNFNVKEKSSPVDNEPPYLTISSGNASSMNVGDSVTAVANKAVSWSSNNTAVATVNNGIITAVGPGSATITALAANGKTATIEVYVNQNQQPSVENLQLSVGSEVNMKVGEVLTITANKSIIMWQSNDSGVATVSSQGVVNAIAAGTTIIAAVDSDNQTATVVVNVIAENIPNQTPENPNSSNNEGTSKPATTNPSGNTTGTTKPSTNTSGNPQTNEGQSSVTQEKVPATGENTVDIIIACVVVTFIVAMFVFRRKSK